MPTATLGELRERVALRAAIHVAAYARHTPEALNREINDSLGRYYQELVDSGLPERVTRTTATTTASTTVTNGWPANQYVSLPSDFKHVSSVHIEFNDQRFPMREFAEVERGAEGYWIPEPEIPRQFRIANDSNGARILRLQPPANGAYTIEIIYTPNLTQLDDDEDTFDFLDGTIELVVSDVALIVLESEDETSSGTYDRILRHREEARALLRRQAGRANRSGPRRMLETDRLVARPARRWTR